MESSVPAYLPKSPSEAALCPPDHPQPRSWTMLQGPTLGYIRDTWSLSPDKHNEDAFTFCIFKLFSSLTTLSLQADIFQSAQLT